MSNTNNQNGGLLQGLFSILILIVSCYLICGCANFMWGCSSNLIVGEWHTIPFCDFVMHLIEKIFSK